MIYSLRLNRSQLYHYQFAQVLDLPLAGKDCSQYCSSIFSNTVKSVFRGHLWVKDKVALYNNNNNNKCFIVNQDAHNEQYNQYKSQYTINSHNNFFHWIGQYKKKITFSKKYSYNGCILVLSSTQTHSIYNLIKAEFQQYYNISCSMMHPKKKKKK